MRTAFRLATVVVAAGGVASAQVQIQPLPAQINPPDVGIAVPARPAVVNNGPTAFQKAVNSPLVVAGTVSLADETVDAPMWRGARANATFRVATIKVTDVFVGDKTKSVRVLLAPADPTYLNEPFPGQPPQPYFNPVPNQIQLIDGQQGVFFLTPHQTVDGAFTPANGNAPLNPLDTDYKEELEDVKRVAAVTEDPIKALKAESPEDRMKAAFVLVSNYRRPPVNTQQPPVEKAIPAEESKLIFKALRDTDWTVWDKPQQPGEVRDWTLNPTNMLSRLQIYAGAQGMGKFPQVRPQPGQGYYAAYKEAFETWLSGDGKDFEIKRFVDPNEK